MPTRYFVLHNTRAMPTHRITAQRGLRVRPAPGTNNTPLGALPLNTQVDVLSGPTNGWCEVRAALIDGVLQGWASADYLAPIATSAPEPEPAWMATARGEIGVREYPGAQHNPRVLEYHDHTGLNAGTDEVPWCSAFVNWVMDQNGIDGTNSAAARSWAAWGRAIAEPRSGCIVVFRRYDPNNRNAGHVAFFITRRGNRIEVLGGNQGDQVCINTYPAADLIGYRWPNT